MYSLFSKSKEIGLKQEDTIFKNPINATSRPCNARTGLSLLSGMPKQHLSSGAKINAHFLYAKGLDKTLKMKRLLI
jgi:hypothetical protein